jgi:hypothetical protein
LTQGPRHGHVGGDVLGRREHRGPSGDRRERGLLVEREARELRVVEHMRQLGEAARIDDGIEPAPRKGGRDRRFQRFVEVSGDISR